MKHIILALFILGLCGLALADIRYSRPAYGSCLCVTASRLNVRSGAGTGNRVVGTVRNGQCFMYTGSRIYADGYYWFSVFHYNQTVWAAGRYLSIDPSQCYAFNQDCLDCLCQVESGCRPLSCSKDVYSNSCGYYQIKSPYYQDCRSPGTSWVSCAGDKSCATTCVRNYINRYYRYCTGSRGPKYCKDAARIHNGGPRGCQKTATISYWNKVKTCLANKEK